MANRLYRITNIAALSILASTYLEKERGFWTANLVALGSSWIGLALLLVFSKELGKFLVFFFEMTNTLTTF